MWNTVNRSISNLVFVRLRSIFIKSKIEPLMPLLQEIMNGLQCYGLMDLIKNHPDVLESAFAQRKISNGLMRNSVSSLHQNSMRKVAARRKWRWMCSNFSWTSWRGALKMVCVTLRMIPALWHLWKKWQKLESFHAWTTILVLRYKISAFGAQVFTVHMNLEISNMDNSKPSISWIIFHFSWMIFKTITTPDNSNSSISRTIFHFPSRFEISRFNCTVPARCNLTLKEFLRTWKECFGQEKEFFEQENTSDWTRKRILSARILCLKKEKYGWPSVAIFN